MRLWHKDLIEVLPREQLVAQWRELSAIAGNIKTKGTPNHILVNKVMDYSFDHFISYAYYIRSEMTNRGYRTMDSVWNKIMSVTDTEYHILPKEELYRGWMNNEYLTICYYNLEEKFLCDGIKNEDFVKIEKIWKNRNLNENKDYFI